MKKHLSITTILSIFILALSLVFGTTVSAQQNTNLNNRQSPSFANTQGEGSENGLQQRQNVTNEPNLQNPQGTNRQTQLKQQTIERVVNMLQKRVENSKQVLGKRSSSVEMLAERLQDRLTSLQQVYNLPFTNSYAKIDEALLLLGEVDEKVLAISINSQITTQEQVRYEIESLKTQVTTLHNEMRQVTSMLKEAVALAKQDIDATKTVNEDTNTNVE